MKTNQLRLVLRTGALVFGLSALALIAIPSVFNSLLGLTQPLLSSSGQCA